jgi:molybdenum cofactor cytidylyltransferase
MPNKTPNPSQTSAIVLAAGNSTRMGSPKFMLKFDSDHTFLEKIIEGYGNFGCRQIITVLNTSGIEILKQQNSKIIGFKQIIINPNSEKEKLFSIQIGLKALKKPELVFIHPVDNPFAEQDILQTLLNNSIKGDYQVPAFNGNGGHPILISEKIAKAIIAFSGSNTHLKNFLIRFEKNYVKVYSNKVLFNINTVQDYKKFLNRKEYNLPEN